MLDATENILLNNLCHPDSNFFNTEIKNFGTPYVIPEQIHSKFKNHMSDAPSFVHVNISSINKNFENFRFICSPETGLNETTISNESFYELLNYSSSEKSKNRRTRLTRYPRICKV